ncbi:MAG: TlpA family protein disulfide reductase [Chloroflexi bacterium]|nr:TlpA family protein disulfide reductase [Chloroflexota bacterium]
MTEHPKKRFPVSILILATIAALFGLGTGLIIVNSNNGQQDGPIVLPTSSFSGLREGVQAPDFTLNTLSGKPVALNSLRGRRVLVNFWASWCPPCLQEMPDLKAAYTALKDDGVEFVGIGLQDETANLQKFVADNVVPYIILEDPKGTVGNAYGVLGMPTTILVDSNGVVRKVFKGPVTKDTVIAEMNKLS